MTVLNVNNKVIYLSFINNAFSNISVYLENEIKWNKLKFAIHYLFSNRVDNVVSLCDRSSLVGSVVIVDQRSLV